MKRDFGSCMLYALFGLPIFLLLFIATIYFANCGFNAQCSGVAQPPIIHTPIPTLIPASLTNPVGGAQVQAKAVCRVTARNLLDTWVTSAVTETQQFSFTDITGNNCVATFADVMPLFTLPGIWYPGALACDACHNSNLDAAADHLDMSSYQGILAGGRRTSLTATGEDILGGGDWQNSILNKVLFVDKSMPFGAPAGALSADGPTIIAGSLVAVPIPAPTEGPSQEEPARPHTAGGAGEAVNLPANPTAGQQVYIDHCQVCHGPEGTDNVLNPGSDDGTVPPLNPIDSTLVSNDYSVYAYNIDLFLQNGSVPEGPNAAFQMPAWGELGILTQQQIADVIAYLISLNPQ
jgi:mono/diheme cytochrome c family protein